MAGHRKATPVVYFATFLAVCTAEAVTEIKIGVILINDVDMVYGYHRTAPAIDMAIERVNNQILNSSYRIVTEMRWYGPDCDGAIAPGLASDLFYKEKVVAFIGPGCTYALDPTARLASYWNVPILTGFGDSGRFRYKEHYHLLTRLAYCQCLMRQVFMGVLDEFQWSDITLIVDRSDVSARVLGESLDEGFQNGGIYPNIVTYYSHEKYDRAALLQEASNKSRVIFFALPHGAVRDFLLTAYDLGHINGDYVFLDTILFESRVLHIYIADGGRAQSSSDSLKLHHTSTCQYIA
ncbi:Atrial natriuretic peptide receptor 3, partial [Lamellibrachia satsuma]